jgi:hypothetical protein
MIIFIISVVIVALAALFLVPIVSSVIRVRLKVLSLFVEIPNEHIVTLSEKC